MMASLQKNMVEEKIRLTRNKKEGTYLPLSVYQKNGYTEEMISSIEETCEARCACREPKNLR